MGGQWNCPHGVSLRGPNPPDCRECELVWLKETAKWLDKAKARNDRRLAALTAEAKGEP